jgi:signal transduction histidine kinase
MFKTLYFKLAAVIVGLFCLIGILFILLSMYATRTYFQEVNQMLNRNLAPHLISEKILMQNGRINEPVVEHIFHQLMVVNPGIEVYLLDLNGRILKFSAPPGKVKRQTISLEPLKGFLNKTASFPVLGDDPRDLEHKKVFSAAPVPLQGPIEGYLYIILGGEEFESVVHMLQSSYVLRLSMWAGVGVLLFALITSLLLFNRMTRPLRQLTTAMETFRQSDFSEPPDILSRFRAHSENEIDRLGMIFMQMAGRIVQQIKELRHHDALRREFVANVSHDLRTPLTSLHGYLETLLLKKEELKPEEQQDYLTIAINRSNQLGKLVNELFDLAKLDSPDIQVRSESFSLVELIQDIVQKFRLSVDKKKIKLQTNFVEHPPLGFADVGLIERVFENLIENAIRHTPENGFITITVVPKEQGLMVQVSDTGSGIQPEDIPRLFDRSYRLKRERPKDAEGAGLGLAITNRILELHQSGIEVKSEVNAGTTFTFTVPVYKTEPSPTVLVR